LSLRVASSCSLAMHSFIIKLHELLQGKVFWDGMWKDDGVVLQHFLPL
jgi:hypothetical protein